MLSLLSVTIRFDSNFLEKYFRRKITLMEPLSVAWFYQCLHHCFWIKLSALVVVVVFFLEAVGRAWLESRSWSSPGNPRAGGEGAWCLPSCRSRNPQVESCVWPGVLSRPLGEGAPPGEGHVMDWSPFLPCASLGHCYVVQCMC